MDKAYVIKQEDGKYFKSHRAPVYQLSDATLFDTKVNAEHDRWTDEKIVEIGELESLQQEIKLLQQKCEIYKKHWIDLCDKIFNNHDKDSWYREIIIEETEKMRKIIKSIE